MGRREPNSSIYKDHFACFECRKAFKQPNVLDLPPAERPRREERVVLCPQCREPMHEMGNAFKAPKRNAVKQWRKVELLFQNGVRFNYYDWGGPGYRPNTIREVEPFLDGTLLRTKGETERGELKRAIKQRKRKK